jgi:hypothetical protein
VRKLKEVESRLEVKNVKQMMVMKDLNIRRNQILQAQGQQE